MLRGTLAKRLEDIGQQLRRDREALRILDEQVAFQQGVVGEAETASVVSETPLAHRERREAEGDLQRLRTQQDALRATIAGLVAEQDDLLDRMFQQGSEV